jgi:hypothetical protein
MNVRRPCRGLSSSFFSIPGLRAATQHSTPGYCSDGAYRRDMVRKRIIAAFCKKYAALAETAALPAVPLLLGAPGGGLDAESA